MSYFTGIDHSPVYDFPYSGHQLPIMPRVDNDLDAILANIAPPTGNQFVCQSPVGTLRCVPQDNINIGNMMPGYGMHGGNNTLVFQVPENMPLDILLEKLGVNPHTLQSSGSMNNYYRSGSQQFNFEFEPSPRKRARRVVCREVSDSDEEDRFFRRRSHSWSNNQDNQQPVALHNLLGKVWSQAERASRNQPNPNINAQWQGMRNAPSPLPPRRNPSVNAWEAMKNNSYPPPRDPAVNAWEAMKNNSYPPPRDPAVNAWEAMKNAYPPPRDPAVNAWEAMRSVSPPMAPANQNAVNNVWNKADYASQFRGNQSPNMFNRPLGPYPNQAAVNNFFASKDVPYGANPSNAAAQDFLAARNIPYGSNLPNPSIANAWSSMNRPPPSWNNNQPRPLPPAASNSVFNVPVRPPNNPPAPMSFASILNQANSRHIPYAGGS